MTTLILVRHGMSLGNKEKRFTGQSDAQLAPEGIRQAEKASVYIQEHYTVDSVYASDLSRAYRTVQGTADALGIPVILKKELREADIGLWQGKTFEEVEKAFPESARQYKENLGLTRFDGGESYGEVMERACRILLEIAEENEGKTVLVGTHGGFIRAFCAAWLGLGIERIREVPAIPNCSVTEAVFENGKFRLNRIGTDEHLRCE